MLHEAINLAATSTGRSKHGCIITTKKGRIIASSVNSYSKTHPKQKHYAVRQGNPQAIHLHAELRAILQGKGEGHTLYVARVTSAGVGMSKPCSMCMDAIVNETGIKKIVYSISNNEYGVIEL